MLRHADGPAADRPAVTRNTYGTGTAWYVATAPDPSTLDAVLRAALADAGLHAPAELPEGVERVERTDGERIWQFVINHADVDAVVPCGTVNSTFPQEPCGWWRRPPSDRLFGHVRRSRSARLADAERDRLVWLPGRVGSSLCLFWEGPGWARAPRGSGRCGAATGFSAG
ncbi:beta-galactosidase trimerization domain-containing protein [Streptacidiphilus monticola]